METQRERERERNKSQQESVRERGAASTPSGPGQSENTLQEEKELRKSGGRSGWKRQSSALLVLHCPIGIDFCSSKLKIFLKEKKKLTESSGQNLAGRELIQFSGFWGPETKV